MVLDKKVFIMGRQNLAIFFCTNKTKYFFALYNFSDPKTPLYLNLCEII